MLSNLWRQTQAVIICAMLAIFAMQGMVAAAGSDTARPLPAAGADFCILDECLESPVDSTEVQEVSPTIEQLSDYVASGVPGSQAGFQLAMPAAPPVFLVSPDLPHLTPPPKG